jgi:hypothetical protein
MRAIERLLAQEIDGKAIVAFAPEGLRCSIERRSLKNWAQKPKPELSCDVEETR